MSGNGSRAAGDEGHGRDVSGDDEGPENPP